MAESVKVTDQTFDSEVLQAEEAVLVDFYADWCGPCLIMAPIVEEIAEERKDQLKVCRVDVTHNMATASRYGIMSIPTLMLFKNGEVVEKVVGAMSKERLQERLDKALS